MDTQRINDLAQTVAEAGRCGAYDCLAIMRDPRQRNLTDAEFVTAVTDAFNHDLPFSERICAYAKCGIPDSIIGWTIRRWASHEQILRINQHRFASSDFWKEVHHTVRHILDLDDTQATALVATSRASPDAGRAAAILRHLAETGVVDRSAADRAAAKA